MPRGFVLQPTYRIERGRPVVTIHGALEGGRPFRIEDRRARPHFWIASDDARRARALGAEPVAGVDVPSSMDGRPLRRVETAIPADVPPLRDRLESAGIRTWEADVRFAYRWLIERGIRGTLALESAEAEATRGRPGPALYEDPDVVPADWTPDLRLLSLDIETDPTGRELLSIALVGCGADEVLVRLPPGVAAAPPVEGGFAVRAYRDERALLEAFVRRVVEIDPDALTGWNVIDFDLAALERMARRRGVALELGRAPGPLRLRAASGPRGAGAATVPGRVVLDGIALLRGAFLRFESYSLQNVASEVLGEGKTIVGSDRGEAILRAWREDLPHFLAYNRKDARLVLDILDRLRLPQLTVERCKLTGMPPDRTQASIASFDFLYLTELHRRGLAAPSVGSGGAGPIEAGGGHVLEPRTGLHENVWVLDFKSLYPSIIRTFHVDPLGAIEGSTADDPIVAPNGARFSREPGILPRLLDALFPRREAAKARGDAVASGAIKILMNSFYGVLGTSACRFASADLANAITGFGREVLLWTKGRVEARGYEVLYGDTDSLFVAAGAAGAGGAAEGGIAAVRARGATLAAELTADLAAHVERTWRTTSRLELELEKLYLRLLLPPARHGTEGARKRYAGLVDDGAEGRVDFVGMEVVRRDWTELAHAVQRELYERLFRDRPVEAWLRETVSGLRAGRFDDRLVYRKSLRKPLADYTASTPPHVAAARKMARPPRRVVRYVVTTAGPEPAAERVSPPDHEHYVQRQVRPVAEPVLALLGLDFDRVVGDDAQLTLF